MSERSTRRVDDDEYVDMDTLVEKFHQGAIWYGMTALNIGWPEELHISGPNVIRLLTHLRDESYYALEDVRKALDHHRVPSPTDLSQADRIHLLVGRKTR
jgi:hypothetical protein